MDTSSRSQNRRSRRSNVMLTAALEADGHSIAVKLRNLSAQGVLVQGKNLPPVGKQLMFKRNELCEWGRVVWVNESHAGIAFQQELKPEQVLRHVPAAKPRVPLDFKRPALACKPLSKEQQKLVESWVWTGASRRPGD